MAEVCCFIYSLERVNDTAVLVSASRALACAKLAQAASGLFTFHELVALLLLVIPGFHYVK